MTNKVLVIAVHPDDETLGCGGTLLKHKSNGDEIHWCICTSLSDKNAMYKKREKEIQQVSMLYNFNSVNNMRLKSTEVDTYNVNFLVSELSKIINKIEPNIIYLPFKGDVHSDHKIIFDAAFSCTKSFRYPFIKKVCMFETLSETEFAPCINENNFSPNIFVDISKFLQKKIDIMSCYTSEISEHPFPRSNKNIQALATFRGAMSNYEYAESFILLKEYL